MGLMFKKILLLVVLFLIPACVREESRVVTNVETFTNQKITCTYHSTGYCYTCGGLDMSGKIRCGFQNSALCPYTGTKIVDYEDFDLTINYNDGTSVTDRKRRILLEHTSCR